VDFSYPALPLKDPKLLTGIASESPYLLPEEWKFLPFLALPGPISPPNFAQLSEDPEDSLSLSVPLSLLPTTTTTTTDGAHKETNDFVYFLLPPRKPGIENAVESDTTDPTTTGGSKGSTKEDTGVFGVSCYRQMDADDLLERSADVTRNRVQKAIVVIASKVLPLDLCCNPTSHPLYISTCSPSLA